MALSFATLAKATPADSKKQELLQIKQEAESIDLQISKIDQKYNQASDKLNNLRGKISITKIKLLKAQKKLKKSKAILNRRIKGMYILGNANFLEMLLSTNSFNDFINRLNFFQIIGNQDASLVADVKLTEKKVKRAKKELIYAAEDQKNAIADLTDKKSEIEKQLDEKKKLIAGVESQINTLEQEQNAIALQNAASQAREAASSPSQDNIPPPSHPPAAGVVGLAYQQLGKPYRWGAAGPDAFDCSGLTMYVYAAVGIQLDHYTGSQYNQGQHVSQANLQPGDLVFFGSDFHHMGLYIGNGEMIHAPQTGDVVKISSAFRSDYYGATRP